MVSPQASHISSHLPSQCLLRFLISIPGCLIKQSQFSVLHDSYLPGIFLIPKSYLCCASSSSSPSSDITAFLQKPTAQCPTPVFLSSAHSQSHSSLAPILLTTQTPFFPISWFQHPGPTNRALHIPLAPSLSFTRLCYNLLLSWPLCLAFEHHLHGFHLHTPWETESKRNRLQALTSGAQLHPTPGQWGAATAGNFSFMSVALGWSDPDTGNVSCSSITGRIPGDVTAWSFPLWGSWCMHSLFMHGSYETA